MSSYSSGVEKRFANRAGISVEEYRDLCAKGLKWCSGCKCWHSREEFYPNAHNADGLYGRCKTTLKRYHAAYRERNRDRVRGWGGGLEGRKLAARQWREENPEYAQKYRERVGERELRSQKLRYRYGITADQFDELFEYQGKQCAVCGARDTGSRIWHVDHDHRCCAGERTCGQCLRGILCQVCNVGSNWDEEELLHRRLAYLTTPPARTLWGDRAVAA